MLRDHHSISVSHLELVSKAVEVGASTTPGTGEELEEHAALARASARSLLLAKSARMLLAC